MKNNESKFAFGLALAVIGLALSVKATHAVDVNPPEAQATVNQEETSNANIINVTVETSDGKVVPLFVNGGTVPPNEIIYFDKATTVPQQMKQVPAVVNSGTLSPNEIKNYSKKIASSTSFSTSDQMKRVPVSGTVPPNEIREFNKILIEPTVGKPFIFSVASGTVPANEQINFDKTSSTTKESLVVKTDDPIKYDGGKIYIKGKEVKIMPNVITDTVSNEVGTSNIKEMSLVNNQDEKPNLVYEVNSEKDVKLLGVFSVKMNILTKVNSTSGQVESVTKPWWGFIATE